MILLDIDHATVLQFRGHSQYEALAERMLAASDPEIGLTVVSLEEQFRGWTAELARRKKVGDQVPIYANLIDLVDFYSRWTIQPFDEAAVATYARLKAQKIRIGTQDLKIAAIALANDALLLSANLVHFQRIPGLKLKTGFTPSRKCNVDC